MGNIAKSVAFLETDDCFKTCANSDEVLEDVKTLLPLEHGGHAFVFKTSADTVLKIFRLPMVAFNGVLPEQLDPYIYFNREVNAYKCLETEMDGHFPKARRIVLITPEHEDELLKSYMRSYKPAKYRRKARKSRQDLPLKALLLDYVEGVRLTKEALLSSPDLRAELLEAISKMHACGVVWGDVKWRNIIVRVLPSQRRSAELSSPQESLCRNDAIQRALVILDFSNACFPLLDELREGLQMDISSGVLSTEEWESKREQELSIAWNMVSHGRLSNSQDTCEAR
ncbi:MAG: hypothetical protein M1830_008495 [Pleopsidium flavum]|nr:MAG: hypothetical protein M1830_008495 [Pleopsidium flavum]